MKAMLALLAFVVALYLAACVFLYLFQRSLIYFPSAYSEHTYPLELFDVEGLQVSALKINEGKDKAILFFSGNADNVLFSAPEFQDWFPDYTLYLLNYRGYAGTDGKPSEDALYHDALSLYDRVKDRHQQISVIGKSLGSGVATYVANNRTIEKLVLITPYDSVLSIAKKRFRFFPAGLLLKDHYDSIGRASGINVPTLIIIAEDDQVIPRWHTDRLLASMSAIEPEVVVISDVPHNIPDSNPAYADAMSRFMLP